MYFLIDWIAWGRVKRRSVTLLTLVLNKSYPLYDHPKEDSSESFFLSLSVECIYTLSQWMKEDRGQDFTYFSL